MNIIVIEYQETVNILKNTAKQPLKLKTKNLVKVIDNSAEHFNTNSQNRFRTSTLKSSLYD